MVFSDRDARGLPGAAALVLAPVPPLQPDDAAGPLGLVAPTTADARDLLDALARLGRREREALLLYEVGGFSVEEVCALQGDRSASAVKSRLSRARARLRADLDDPLPPLPHRPRAMTTLDALRPTTPDSFDRAADWLRTPRPRRGRRRALVLAVALAASVGACSYPVEGDQTVGYDIEWTTYGSAELGNYTVKRLDGLVPPEQRLAIETRRAERPAVPPDHAYPPGATWTRVRYSLATADPAAAKALADSMRVLMGAYNVSVAPVVQPRRMPLVAAALGRVGVAVNPGDESVSDRELQRFIDDQLERLDLAPDAYERNFPPRVGRLPDGRRALFRHPGDATVLDPTTRLWFRTGSHGRSGLDVEGVSDEHLLFRTESGWRSAREVFGKHNSDSEDDEAPSAARP